MLQDIYSTENGYGYINDFKTYNKALTNAELRESAAPSSLSYSLDGIDFKAWDIYVSESNGLLDRPKLKPGLKIDWDDYHGEIIDLKNKRVEAREITLNCFMKATGKVDFVNKLKPLLRRIQPGRNPAFNGRYTPNKTAAIRSLQRKRCNYWQTLER